MIFRAPAKINLGLHIKHKREDGFHELESVFHTISLFDYVELIPSSSDVFFSYNLEIPGDSSTNLCMQALSLLRNKGHNIPNYEVHLLKNISIGAGLGGGSSDATTVLKAVNQMNKLGLNAETLSEYAAELGSDCPFFLLDSAALVKGRGEILTPLDFSLKGYFLHLVNPKIHISTGTAYGSLDLNVTSKNEISIPVAEDEWSDSFVNDFEKALWPKYPQLWEIKLKLKNAGAFYASLSGSGSSVFGIFKTKPKELLFEGLYDEWILEL